MNEALKESQTSYRNTARARTEVMIDCCVFVSHVLGTGSDCNHENNKKDKQKKRINCSQIAL